LLYYVNGDDGNEAKPSLLAWINSTMHNLCGIAAPVISMVAFIPYLRSILRNKTKPSAASWWTWTLLTFVAVASSRASGAHWQVLLLPLWLCFSQLTVAILATKFGNNNWDFKNTLLESLRLVFWSG
jgi:hypothetical protein